MSEVRDDPITEEISGKRMVTPTQNPSLQISPVKLDGSTYPAWSCSCKLFIKAHGLEDYITGVRGQKPATNDPTATKLELEFSCNVLAD